MAIYAGHEASFSIANGSSGTDPQKIYSGKVHTWAVTSEAQPVDVTPFASNSLRLWPSQPQTTLEIWGYLDQATGPGWLSTPQEQYSLQVTVYPRSADTGKYFRLTVAMCDLVRWVASIDEPNSFYARFHGASDGTYAWS